MILVFFVENHKMSFYLYDKIVNIVRDNVDDIPFEYHIFKCKKKMNSVF